MRQRPSRDEYGRHGLAPEGTHGAETRIEPLPVEADADPMSWLRDRPEEQDDSPTEGAEGGRSAGGGTATWRAPTPTGRTPKCPTTAPSRSP